MYKLFTQAQYDDNGTRRQLVNAVYADDPTHPRLPTCEGVYDQDTNVKWWQCSTDELLLDDREYKCFMLQQDEDGKPEKRNIVFNKQGEVALLCNDAEWCKITKQYKINFPYIKPTIENIIEIPYPSDNSHGIDLYRVQYISPLDEGCYELTMGWMERVKLTEDIYPRAKIMAQWKAVRNK